MIYKKIKESLRKEKLAQHYHKNFSNNTNDEDIDFNYDSDSVKSTESIHEARRKIENHQKIITLLNNLSALDLSDPIVKAEYLKNVIDFEEKYGKLEEEEERPQTKISNESNKDKSPKNMELKEELKNFNLKYEKSNTLYLETQTKKLEEDINEGSNNLNLDFLNKLDDLKKDYDSLIKTDKISLEALIQEPEMTQIFLKENQNTLIDNLFLTNLPNSDQIKPIEKDKDDIKIDINREILPKSETEQQENLINTEHSQEKKILSLFNLQTSLKMTFL